jgi:hypothetical protein
MAVVGVESFEEPFVTRADVTVDVDCEPVDGKMLLDALEAVRLPRGMRVESAGKPRSTVYFKPRESRDVLARAYCKNLERKDGAPFAWIRLESVHRFRPGEWPLRYLFSGNVAAAMLWESRYGTTNVKGRYTRLEREAQVVTLSQRMRLGEISLAQFERMNAFLDAERLGIARQVYNDRQYAERRREAQKLGLSTNDVGEEPVDFDLDDLLAPIRAVWTPAA